jgi:phospho-N-acetylmuramoyl-pentapeptide-transferase
MGQKILDIGPRWHKGKEGTPTMGGLAMLIAAFITGLGVIIYCIYNDGIAPNVKLICTVVMALLYGAIGIIDDRVKLLKKQNEGLTAKQKYLLQLVIAGLYLVVLTLTDNLSTVLHIPFTSLELDLGYFYYIFALILITGIVNAANLTDGIDGLASTVTLIIGGSFAAFASKIGESATDVSALSGILMGVCLGFLVYNAYPAKIFMGDTGSLFLGGVVSGLAFMIDEPLIVVLCGLVYIIEACSVIIQVGYFKLTGGKRFFKMAPIHHHFEKMGWSEVTVVRRFWAFSLLMGIIGLAALL